MVAGCGFRSGEIAALKRASSDWLGGTLMVEQYKTRSVLVLPLAPDTVQAAVPSRMWLGASLGAQPTISETSHPASGRAVQATMMSNEVRRP